MLSCRKIRLNNSRCQSKLPETKTSKQKSASSKRQNMQKQQDKRERRRAKRQGRRTGGNTTSFKQSVATPDRFPATHTESVDSTEKPVEDWTGQEMLETIEKTRRDFANLLQNGNDDPTTRKLLEVYSGLDQKFIEWEK